MTAQLSGGCLRLGGRAILKGLDLTVPTGLVTVIVGPNGAGKSTALSLLTGERPPDAGTAEIGGRPLTAWEPEDLARRRAVLPQSTSLPFAFSVAEVVMLGRAPHRRHSSAAKDRAVCTAALRAADVGHLAGRMFPTLSGGERQRVALARALAQIWDPPEDNGPRYLFLDEPTASLDPSHQHRTLSLAKTLARQGVAVCAVLHDLSLAATYADRLAVIAEGRTVAAGAVDTILTPAVLEPVFDCTITLHGTPGRPGCAVITGPAESYRPASVAVG